MSRKANSNLPEMEMELKRAIKEYYLYENKEAILKVQDLSTKMAILHGFTSKTVTNADSYVIHLDEHCKTMPMSYSYKAVLLLKLLNDGKNIVPVSIDDMGAWFIKYYSSRQKKHLHPEKDGLLCQRKPDYNLVIRNIKANPIKALEKEGVITFDGKEIKFTNRIYTEEASWAKKAKQACKVRLEEYFKKI